MLQLISISLICTLINFTANVTLFYQVLLYLQESWKDTQTLNAFYDYRCFIEVKETISMKYETDNLTSALLIP